MVSADVSQAGVDGDMVACWVLMRCLRRRYHTEPLPLLSVTDFLQDGRSMAECLRQQLRARLGARLGYSAESTATPICISYFFMNGMANGG